MNNLERVTESIRAYEDELRASGIRRLCIFGSVARGDARPDSDVDIGVELEPDAHLGLRFFALEKRLSELLGRPVQLLAEPVRSTRLRENLERDRRLVF